MPTPRALRRFVVDRLGLQRYMAKPGGGRQQPVIPARVLLWAMLVGRVLRENTPTAPTAPTPPTPRQPSDFVNLSR